MRKAERCVSKQGQLQPRIHGQVTKHTTVKWPINETTKMTYSFCCVVLNLRIKFGSNISKTSASVSSGFQTQELMKA